MSLQHLNVKLFLDGPLTINLEDVITLFHRWVAEQSWDEMLIDVADYRHVPEGPSVVLVGHEAHYIFDNTDGKYGLVYNRRTTVEGSDKQRVAQAFYGAAALCEKLEAEFPDLRFSRDRFQVVVNDRALAAVGSDGEQQLKDSVQAFVTETLGQDAEIQTQQNRKRRAGLHVRLAQPCSFSA